jgi:energy-coupling factor transporter ATP-binding protein EcfA2
MTRLKSISIRNFKAYKGLQEIPLKPLTLIFGPNSSGKSSIIHALAFLKHVYLKNGDCSPDEVDLVWDKVTLGGWQNLLHGHDPKQSMQLGIEFGENISSKWTFEGSNQGSRSSQCVIAHDGRPLASAVNKRPRQLGWEITFDDQHPKLTSLADRIWSFLWKGEQLRPVSHTHKGSSKLPWEQFHTQFLDYMRLVPIESSGLFPGALHEVQLKRLQAKQLSRSGPDFGDVWKTKLPSGEETQVDGQAIRMALRAALESGMRATSHLQDLFRHCIKVVSINEELSDEPGVQAFEQLFQSHVHLGPSREAPPRDIDHQSLDNNAKFGPWLELLDKQELREQVNQALGRLGLNYELVTRWKEAITYYPDSGESPPKYDPTTVEFSDPKKQLAFQIKGSRVTLSHRDLGYGVSMVLPILVALHSTEFDLITMEQPELHIHPRQQAELGDELIAATLRAEKSKQLIIETHSENLILRILKRIRQTTMGQLPEGATAITKNDVTILFVNPSSDGAHVMELRISDKGKFLDSWPGGFFEESFDEMF